MPQGCPGGARVDHATHRGSHASAIVDEQIRSHRIVFGGLLLLFRVEGALPIHVEQWALFVIADGWLSE